MGPPSFMRSVVDRNVAMRRMTVFAHLDDAGLHLTQLHSQLLLLCRKTGSVQHSVSITRFFPPLNKHVSQGDDAESPNKRHILLCRSKATSLIPSHNGFIVTFFGT